MNKQEKENIIKQVGLKIEYGEEPVHSIDRHKFKTVGDSKHSEILALYISENKSMQKIANQQNRSVATIHKQIKDHDEAVARSGFCHHCKRVHGLYETELTVKKEGKISGLT